MTAPFNPDWCMAPSALIVEEILERGWTLESLSERSGINLHDILDVTERFKPIDTEFARRFGEATGTSAEIWLRLDLGYRVGLAAGKQDVTERCICGWDQEHPERARLSIFCQVHDI